MPLKNPCGGTLSKLGEEGVSERFLLKVPFYYKTFFWLGEGSSYSFSKEVKEKVAHAHLTKFNKMMTMMMK